MMLWKKGRILIKGILSAKASANFFQETGNLFWSTGNSFSHRKASSNWKPFRDIPGPKPLPIIGNIWRYLPVIGEYDFEKIHRSYQKMFQQYGPLVKEKLIGRKVIVHVFDPADIWEVYSHEGTYPQRLSHSALAKYRKERPETYKSVGLFPSNGEEWRRFRNKFQSILLHPGPSKFHSRHLEGVTDDFVTRIRSILDYNKEADLQPELFKWALECIGTVALNRRLGCLHPDMAEKVQKLVNAAHDTHEAVYATEMTPLFLSRSSYKKLVAAQDYIAGEVRKYIEEALSKKGQSYLEDSVLFQMMNEGADFKDAFTMILDMFMAGIDTTAYTTAFALYNLAKNPEAQQKLREELITAFPQKNDRMSEQLDFLPYVNNVIKESLRINPVAIGNGRVLDRDMTLSGYRVPAGTHVILHHQAASLFYFSEAQKFSPERWERTESKKKNRPSFASMPFGFGPRVCIGRRFALQEMRLAISKIVRNFTIEYHYEDIDSKMRLINVPDKPLKLRLHDFES